MEREIGVRGMRGRWGRPGLGLVIIGLIVSFLFPLFAFADDLPNQEPSGFPPPPGQMQLGFDPNDYRFLVYDTQGTQASAQAAMRAIGIPDNRITVRYSGNSVTLNDLATHDILIVGWNYNGDMGGLNSSILAQGITGAVLLTGHDADYHTAHTLARTPGAGVFLAQAIEMILNKSGTGLLVMGDPSALFSWLPAAWGITAPNQIGETVTVFTPQGLASGVYQGLEPTDMCDWGTSYHNTFTAWGTAFVPFEKGGDSGQDVITIARTQPTGPAVHKVDDKTGCVEPGNAITYTITVDPDGRDHAWVTVVDTLPRGVTYDPVISLNPITLDPKYNDTTHTYTWELGALPASHAPVILTLTVTVNGFAEPGGGNLRNEVLAESDLGTGYAVENTPVCCWGGSVIFVDPRATGFGNGTSWTDAYTDLQKALARAGRSCGTEIRIARGQYNPGWGTGTTFSIPAGVSVYGGYRGGAVDPDDRRPKEYGTILSGLIDANNRNTSVVTMGNNSLLDGVTVREASDTGQGILANDVTYTLSNCVIEDNLQYGIRGVGCHAMIQWCIIQKNEFHGIFQDGIENTITVENCRIQDNQRYGLDLEDSISIVKNSVINRNGLTNPGFFGIWVNNPAVTPHFHNNTIAFNRKAGIAYTADNDPQYLHKPDIQNCILWYNNQAGNGEQCSGYWIIPHYSCVYDPNDPSGTRTTFYGDHNFSHKPDFAYNNEPNNVHLAANSYCINKGNPGLTYTGQMDIDGEERVMGSFVDVGADEVNPECNDVFNAYDWNADGVINYGEFEKFSRAWLTCDPNRPGGTGGYDPNDLRHWNPRCDLDLDYDVDLADLMLFIPNWLWTACWRLDLQPEQLEMMMSMTPAGGIQMQSLSLSDSFAVKTATIMPEKPIREQILELKDTIQFLEEIWLNDPSVRQEIDADEWQQFIRKVYDSFNELKTMNTNSLDVSEELQ
jgi:uncharacterized repeat protein (TIGR01451 family)